MRRVFLSSIVLFLFAASSIAGQLLTETITSSALGRDETVNIYLPTGFDPEGSEVYPVLYFLHGGNTARSAYFDLNDSLETVIAAGGQSMIIVYPNGDDISFFTDSDAMGNYETHFLQEVIPFIEANYPVYAQRSGRAMMGHSMGATGAARIAVQYPDMFMGFASIGGQPDLHRMLEVMAPYVEDEAGLGAMPAPDMGNWCEFLYQVSSLWSPNPSATYGCDPAIGVRGEIDETVFERWKVNDPYTIVENQGDAFNLAIYLDAGSIDIWKPVSRTFHDLLVSLDVDHHFEVYIGNHTNLEIQYPSALSYMGDAFVTALEVPEVGTRELPDRALLIDAWPNPFNGTASVTIQLAQPGVVSLGLYDLLGRRVLTLHEGHVPAGSRQFSLEADGLASGCYFLRAETVGGASQTRRLVLVR